MAGELVDDVPRQIGAAHVGQRCRVDDVARRAAQQTTQESQARFSRPGAECGEPVGADVGGETAFAGMARAGVVDGDEGRASKSRPQHRLVLGAEILKLGGQKPHHLALGDRQAQAGQKRHDPLAGHLALKMKHQHQTMQMRAAAAHNPRRQRRNQPLAVRRLPPLAPTFFPAGPFSDDTILRHLKRQVARLCAKTTVRVAGIDDWSWRKGCTYGTIVVDLERREVVDVLADRTTTGTAE